MLTIAAEACGTAHHSARTLIAMGYDLRLIPPSCVKVFVKRGKSDALDAEVICEAVQRPNMKFVPVKTVEQHAILMTHRARSLLVRQRTMLANALRGDFAELGVVANPAVANHAKPPGNPKKGPIRLGQSTSQCRRIIGSNSYRRRLRRS